MENAVNKRILMLKTQLGLTDVEFCGRASISTSTLNKIKSEESVTQKILDSITQTFNVNSNWLMTGKGKMINEVAKSSSTDSPWKDEAFKALKEEVAFYRELLKQMAGNKANFLHTLNGTGLRKSKSLRAAA